MRRLMATLLFLALWLPVCSYAGNFGSEHNDYMYDRDLTIPPFHSQRQYFDLPDHPGNYEITLVSESVGPLTFKVMQVHGLREVTLKQYRSYHIHNHDFHLNFHDTDGQTDLAVDIANSNPAASAKVTVIVVQLP